MAIFNREGGARTEASVKAAFRTDGFGEFLEEFDDAHNVQPQNPDYEQVILQRFDAFKRLPGVIETVRKLAQEKNSNLLGRTFTEGELKTVDDEIRRLVVKDQNFRLLDTLSEQAHQYRELPQEIMRQQAHLATLGNRDTLEHRAMGINHSIAHKESKIREAEGSHEGMALAKEGVKVVKDLEKGLNLAEAVFTQEAESLTQGYKRTFDQLEIVIDKVTAVDQTSPQPGTPNLPELSLLGRNFKELESKKKDPSEYLQMLASLSLGEELEGAKEQIAQAVNGKVGALRKLGNKKREAEKYPNLSQCINEFDAIRVEVGNIVIDKRGDSQFEDLNNDLIQVVGIRQGLGYLENDPASRQIRIRIEDASHEFRTTSGISLSSRLKFGLTELSQIQSRLDMFPANDDDIRTSVSHSQKGFMRRLISRDPAKKLRKQAETNAGEVEVLELQKQEIVDRIHTIEDAEYQLRLIKDNFSMNYLELSKSLKSFDSLFKKAALDAKNSLNTQLDSEDPTQVLKAKQAMDRLAVAREQAPELYGAIDTDDDMYDTSFSGNQNLRDLQKNYAEILRVKIEDGVRKALTALDSKKIRPESVAAKLLEFETGLGSLTNTSEYRRIRLQAFRNVASSSSIFPAGKKAVLGQMLREAEEEGFMRNGFDLKGFVNAAA